MTEGGEQGLGPSVAAALAVGAAAGVLAALLAGAAFEPFALIGFWGRLWGALAGTVAFGAALLRLAPRRWLRAVGRYLAAAVLLVVAAAVGWINVAWGVPVWSLEGAWLWPLCLGSALLAGLLLVVGRRRR